MPTETTEMLTLQAMQNTARADLRSIALVTLNREYSRSLDAMANAMDEYTLAGNKRSAKMEEYVAAAKLHHKQAQEDEFGRVLRVRATRASIAADGVQTGNVEVSGLATHFTQIETHKSNGAARRLVGVRS
jgi:hypothetical protein